MFAGGGRYFGFGIGCFFQVLAGFIGALAVSSEQLSLLLFCCVIVGFSNGLGMFYRFAAVEVSPPEYKIRAVTYTMTSGIFAAIMGPICATYPSNMFPTLYLRSFGTMALIDISNYLALSLVIFPAKDRGSWWTELPASTSFSMPKLERPLLQDTSQSKQEVENKQQQNQSAPLSKRKLSEIISQPLFIISCIVATLANSVRIALMSQVTLSMKSQNFSLNTISLVMTMHFCGMVLPIAGPLITKYGSFLVALAGVFIYLGSCFVFIIGTDLWNYIFGMILLGIGWNFSFSAGTVMVTSTYLPAEASKAQAVNVFILFICGGTLAAVSGFLYVAFGWQNFVFTMGAIIILNFLIFIKAWDYKNQLDKDGSDNILAQQDLKNPQLFKPGDVQFTSEDQDGVGVEDGYGADDVEEAGRLFDSKFKEKRDKSMEKVYDDDLFGGLVISSETNPEIARSLRMAPRMNSIDSIGSWVLGGSEDIRRREVSVNIMRTVSTSL